MNVFLHVPTSVIAKTREELSRACLKLQLRDKVRYNFFDFSQATEKGKPVWICWYIKDYSLKHFPKEL